MRAGIFKIAIPPLAVVLSLCISALLIMAAGKNPLFIYQKMFTMTLGSEYGTGQIVFRATSLVFAGLAVAIPFKLKLFNIGGEGQMLAGAFSAALAGTLLPPQTHPVLAVFFCTLSAITAGASVALLSGWLKVSFGVNEVISTIMLNFIVQACAGFLLTGNLSVPSTAHTYEIVPSAQIPQFDTVFGIWQKSPANFSTLFALAACFGLWFLVFKTIPGYEMRAAGLHPEAARYAGIDTNFHILKAMGIGGAMAGLAAANLVLGYKHYYESGLTDGIGFMGIAVALLAFAHPVWIIGSAMLFGFLQYGGLSVNAYVPKDIFLMVQAVTILMILILTKFLHRN